MKIEVFGSGCAKCKELEKRVREAVAKVGLKVEVEHVYDINKIVEKGIYTTPALAVDGKVLVAGRLPEIPELVSLLKK